MLEQVIKGFASPAFLRDRYERFHTRYADHGEAGRYFVTFVDNHDRPARFLHGNPYPQHPIYQSIRHIAQIRHHQPALRYGRQYFREISGDGVAFGHPLAPGECTLAYSRILDTEEILVCLNLQNQPRQDCITVDRKLSAPGSAMKNLLDPQQTGLVMEANGRAYVRVSLPPHGIAIMKSG